jgi:hypothetical protein
MIDWADLFDKEFISIEKGKGECVIMTCDDARYGFFPHANFDDFEVEFFPGRITEWIGVSNYEWEMFRISSISYSFGAPSEDSGLFDALIAIDFHRKDEVIGVKIHSRVKDVGQQIVSCKEIPKFRPKFDD